MNRDPKIDEIPEIKGDVAGGLTKLLQRFREVVNALVRERGPFGVGDNKGGGDLVVYANVIDTSTNAVTLNQVTIPGATAGQALSASDVS